jgi:hypothetical protein
MLPLLMIARSWIDNAVHTKLKEFYGRTKQTEKQKAVTKSIKQPKSQTTHLSSIVESRGPQTNYPHSTKLRDNLRTVDSDNDIKYEEPSDVDDKPKPPARKVKQERPVEPSAPPRVSARRSTMTNREDMNPLFHSLPQPLPTRRQPKFEEERAYQYRWQKPLIYPATGKNKTTVEFDDLKRFDDGEMLNDNLVSFHLRYLEELNPQIRDRIYDEEGQNK